MPRTRHVTWTYECDEGEHEDDFYTPELEVSRGDHVNTGRGTVVRDQADADAYARAQGWSVGRYVLCPEHAGVES